MATTRGPITAYTVKELGLNSHSRGIEKLIWFLDYGNLNLPTYGP